MRIYALLFVVLVLLVAAMPGWTGPRQDAEELLGLMSPKEVPAVVISGTCSSTYSHGKYPLSRNVFIARRMGADVLVEAESADMVMAMNNLDDYVSVCRDLSGEFNAIYDTLIIPGLVFTVGGPYTKVQEIKGEPNGLVCLMSIGIPTQDVCKKVAAYLGTRSQTYRTEERTIKPDIAQARVSEILFQAGLAVVSSGPLMSDHESHGQSSFYGGTGRRGVQYLVSRTASRRGFVYSLGPFVVMCHSNGPGGEFEKDDWGGLNVVGLSRLLIPQRSGLFESDCREVANGLRKGDSTILALPERYRAGNLGAAKISQGLKSYGSLQDLVSKAMPRDLDPDKPVLLYAPGSAVARCLLGNITINQLSGESATHRSARASRLSYALDRREQVLAGQFDLVFGW